MVRRLHEGWLCAGGKEVKRTATSAGKHRTGSDQTGANQTGARKSASAGSAQEGRVCALRLCEAGSLELCARAGGHRLAPVGGTSALASDTL